MRNKRVPTQCLVCKNIVIMRLQAHVTVLGIRMGSQRFKPLEAITWASTLLPDERLSYGLNGSII